MPRSTPRLGGQDALTSGIPRDDGSKLALYFLLFVEFGQESIFGRTRVSVIIGLEAVFGYPACVLRIESESVFG